MAFAPIAFTIPNYRDFKNYWLKAYVPGATTTPKLMATDATGLTTVAKFELNKDGFPVTAGDALITPYIAGRYDLWAFPTEAEADANDTINAERFAIDVLAPPTDGVTVAQTLAEATADPGAAAGQTVRITDRANGLFGWLTGETPNTSTIVAHDTLPLQLSLIIENGVLIAEQAGFDPSPAFDNTDILTTIPFSGIAEILYGFGTFEFSELNMLNNQTLITGVAGRTTFSVHSSASVSDWAKFGSAAGITVGGGIQRVKIEGDAKARNGILLKNTSEITMNDLEMKGFIRNLTGQGALSFNLDNFKSSDFSTGVQFRKSDPGDSVTVYPNHIQFTGQTQFTGGTGKAVDYDEGIGLFFEKLQVDFTGTTTDTTTGGVFVGANVGDEVASSLYPAIRIKEAIFESIKGRPLEVLSGSVVIDTFTGVNNEDRYVLDTSSGIFVSNMIDASSNGKIESRSTNNKQVYSNTVMTNGITAVGGGSLNESAILMNSGTGAEAQNGFRDLALLDLYIGPKPVDNVASAALSIGDRIGFQRLGTDPASGPDGDGYIYERTNGYVSQDGLRYRGRSHSFHTHTNAFQMGISDAGNVTATSFTPFTGVHYFYSAAPIERGLAVDLVDATERDVFMFVDIDGASEEEVQPFKSGGKVTISNNESKVCAGIVKDCDPIVGGFLISVAAVGDNRAGELKGFKIDSCQAGDILCTSTGGMLKVAPVDITREVVTFKAMSEAVNGIAYGYF